MRPSVTSAGAVVVASIAACTVPPPFHTLETAATLERKQVAVTLGGGGGTGEDLKRCCGGAAGRVRVGIGGRQEVGVDATTLIAAEGIGAGLKLAYKIAPWERLAFTAGAGAFFAENVNSYGADLGAIVSGRDGPGFVPYTAVRVSAATAAGNPSETLTVPIGVSKKLDGNWRAMIELGGVGALSQLKRNDMPTTEATVGFYGGLAFTYRP
jgi:hypothetical protein